MSQFERRYDERICSLTFSNLSDEEEPDAQTSPGIVLDTLSLTLSAVDNKVNLVVSTPSRDGFGRVLATLIAIKTVLQTDGSRRV